ncbi:ABC transporter ATP-binding protein [Hyphomicrobium sp.]|uniref:ABC transporter ATP-binding protein n=1 Tax=Hyphomicrobium sp. TaxID=82 RepID=UPI002BAE13BC|nr:ABC transporter ATP-binding protein [Hyphomicrobium sp.]HVZ03614.1 ABC transporter ATP-binding protein [Hyphomicrobium sp.]
MTAIAELDHVTKRYGAIEAVRDVSLKLEAGETVALVGHNGAGKTTLFKLMVGLSRPTSGSIRVLGDDPAAGEFAARKRLGYLPESVSFNGALTGREVLSFYVRLKDVPMAKIDELLARVGLTAASNRPIRTYSKGMRQRLGLIQALFGDPLLLLLDEPTTGLDPALRQEFYEIVQELQQAGATIVLSSHALTELEERARRVIIMNRGVVVANGSIEQLHRIAGLPVRIRVTVASGQAQGLAALVGPVPNWREINGHLVEFDAAPGAKIALIRRATDKGGPAEDVTIIQPTLDDLYAHFLRTHGEAL